MTNRLAWAAYLGEDHGEEVPPYAAPARAPDLTGLPPTWLATADLDLFAEEDITYARRLVASGVSSELHVYPVPTTVSICSARMPTSLDGSWPNGMLRCQGSWDLRLLPREVSRRPDSHASPAGELMIGRGEAPGLECFAM